MTDPNPGTVHTMEEEMRAAGQGVFEKPATRKPTPRPVSAETVKPAPARKTKRKGK